MFRFSTHLTIWDTEEDGGGAFGVAALASWGTRFVTVSWHVPRLLGSYWREFLYDRFYSQKGDDETRPENWVSSIRVLGFGVTAGNEAE